MYMFNIGVKLVVISSLFCQIFNILRQPKSLLFITERSIVAPSPAARRDAFCVGGLQSDPVALVRLAGSELLSVGGRS